MWRGGGAPARDTLDALLDRIYEHHVADVHRWVRRLAGPRDDVEDLVHEVFLVAVRRRGEFRGDGKVTTWLFRITELIVKERRHREHTRRWLFARHGDDLVTKGVPVVTPLEDIEQRERVGGGGDGGGGHGNLFCGAGAAKGVFPAARNRGGTRR